MLGRQREEGGRVGGLEGGNHGRAGGEGERTGQLYIVLCRV